MDHCLAPKTDQTQKGNNCYCAAVFRVGWGILASEQHGEAHGDCRQLDLKKGNKISCRKYLVAQTNPKDRRIILLNGK